MIDATYSTRPLCYDARRVSHGPSDPDRARLARRITELTRERDEALAAAGAERERSQALLRQCDRLAAEILALRRGTAPPWEPALMSDQARHLAEARQTIRNMERSWFWRARLAYRRLVALVRLRAR